MSIVEDARERAYVIETSLTGSEYSDPEVFRRETSRIFRRQWLAVGRSSLAGGSGEIEDALRAP